ncbi:MAG: tyrosine-type recombinase/integrase [Acidimicrobiales bacterium]
MASLDDIDRLEAALPKHLRIVVPLAVWCQLRRGEILGLQRRDICLQELTLEVRRSRTFDMSGNPIMKAPKSRAGVRSLAIPTEVARRLREHMEEFVSENEDAQIVCDGSGRPLSANSLHGHWRRAREKMGVPEIRFHDLRHAGLTYAAATGATTVELMHRAGHASAAAAMRYQHAMKDRDRSMAMALDSFILRNNESNDS